MLTSCYNDKNQKSILTFESLSTSFIQSLM